MADGVCLSGSSIDLLKVEQKNPAAAGGYDLVASYTYNAQHRPLTTTDSAGQTTTATYNGNGQIATITTPARAGITENRTTTYTYDTATGYLQNVAGPVSGATVSFTYDGYGRPRTTTDPSGYVVTYDYDSLDRVTKTSYPDNTYEQMVYNRLDPEQRRDRLGRWSHVFYDALRRPTSSRDAAGRTVTREWCNCGSLDRMIDGKTNVISWERDLQGRVTKEKRPDNTFTQFTYENTTSRLKQQLDRKSQTKDFTYFLDDRLKQVIYGNAQYATPTVSYTYDPNYARRATLSDGTGLTTWNYNPITVPPSLGAARLGSISGPVGSSTYTMSLTYDERGRATGRSIGGASITESLDALGRLASQTDPLGAFIYTHVGATGRLSSVAYPNSQVMSFVYFDTLGDNRLQEIKHLDPGQSILSKFNYTYDAMGNAKTWSQQAGAGAAKLYTLSYDNVGQVQSAVISGVTPLPVPSRFAYAYDNGGNRTAEQLDDAVTGATYNELNELKSTQPGGALLFRGSVNEPATVSVGGSAAAVAADNTFRGTAVVPSGTGTVVVSATDPSGNTRSNTYQVTASGASRTLIYDLNGNLTNDGSRTYEWDAENRLVGVNQGNQRSEFTYNGLNQRIRIVEKLSGAVTGDKRFVWCGLRPCQERDATGATVTRDFYRHGFLDGTTKYFTTVDHLGSTREITNLSGALVARYDYDPYGRMTTVSGSYSAPFGFTGHYVHGTTGLVLPLYRAYAADLGRWTSEDPAGRVDGPNFFAYVRGNPVSLVDPTGEMTANQTACYGNWILVGGIIGGVLGASAGTVVTVGTAGIAVPAIPGGWMGGMAGGAAAGAGMAALVCAPPPAMICPLPWTRLPPPWPPEEEERCQRARSECNAECSDELGLPGFNFDKCRRDCMIRKGCGF